jgi:hypothetical protein
MRHREFNIILRFWESGAAEASGRMAAEEAQEELSEEISRCARGELDQAELVSLCRVLHRRPDLIEALAQEIRKRHPQKRPARRGPKKPEPRGT